MALHRHGITNSSRRVELGSGGPSIERDVYLPCLSILRDYQYVVKPGLPAGRTLRLSGS